MPYMFCQFRKNLSTMKILMHMNLCLTKAAQTNYISSSDALLGKLKFRDLVSFHVPHETSPDILCSDISSLDWLGTAPAETPRSKYFLNDIKCQSLNKALFQLISNGNTEEQAFIQNLALFFTSFYKSHIRVLESSQENINALLIGFEYLINISYVDDTEVFKVSLDYWNSLVLEFFEAHHNLDNPAVTANMMGLQMLIVENENGNIVRETMKANDVLVQYKIMRKTLIYLAHLNYKMCAMFGDDQLASVS